MQRSYDRRGLFSRQIRHARRTAGVHELSKVKQRRVPNVACTNEDEERR